MLYHLSIQNFAVVRALEIEFEAGLTAITGETGAGKSIMVDALNLALGDRADSGVIREGTERAEICATFDIEDKPEVKHWLSEHGFDVNLCILRRVISKDGRSRAFINGSPATLSQLKELGEPLIDIHSQHEHQSLLRKGSHSTILDAYSETTELAKQVKEAYHLWRTTRDKLESAEQGSQVRQNQLDLLNYHLLELDQLALEEEELQRLESELNRLNEAEKILQLGQQALSLCSSKDTTGDAGVTDLLSGAIKSAESIRDDSPQLSNTIELLNSARIHCEEAVSSLADYLSAIAINPERQATVEQRLDAIYDLARKHKVLPEAIPELHRELQQQQEALTGSGEDQETLRKLLEKQQADYDSVASELSTKRKKQLATFDSAVTQRLASLGMQGSQFSVQLQPTEHREPHPNGLEEIEFLISTNPGQSLRPLAKIASGGELSRISLSIQVVSAQVMAPPTLIFDEVDVGIGGATAEVVGNMLRALGEQGQVICVTHQPQVASKSHKHYSVNKETADTATDSVVKVLNKKERVAEIARMLGGIKLTDQTMAHAEEMLVAAEN